MKAFEKVIKAVLPSLILILVLGACTNIPVTGSEEIGSQLDQAGVIPDEDAVSETTAMEVGSGSDSGTMTSEVQHMVYPEEFLSEGLIKEEIDTSKTAAKKTAVGDSLRLGNLERPFTQTEMVYHPEIDLLSVGIRDEADYYYFSLELSGIDEQMGYPSAFYGIEIDTDLDGRGDYLLWARGDGNTSWNIDDVMILRDTDKDVGGSLAVIPDSNPGNGYEEVLFSKDMLDDPDAAWKRTDPEKLNIVQLAMKKDLVGNAYFLWKAWSDGGLADPAMFDYNDHFTDPQAGSPQAESELYPLNQLSLVDSTCWIAFNFQPIGNEQGGCYKAPAKVEVSPKVAPTPDQVPDVPR